MSTTTDAHIKWLQYRIRLVRKNKQRQRNRELFAECMPGRYVRVPSSFWERVELDLLNELQARLLEKEL